MKHGKKKKKQKYSSLIDLCVPLIKNCISGTLLPVRLTVVNLLKKQWKIAKKLATSATIYYQVQNAIFRDNILKIFIFI